MKRLSVFLIAAAMAACLCACGTSQLVSISDGAASQESALSKEEITNNFNKAVAYIESTIDTSDMTVQAEDEDTETSYRHWMYDDMMENASLSADVFVDGNQITIGKTTVNELESFGMGVEKYADTVQPNESVGVNLTKDNKEFILSVLSNNTDKEQPVDDLPIGGFTTGFEELTLPFSYAGLTYGSTMEDALAALGMPNSSISLSADDISTNINLSYFNSEEDKDMTATTTVELTFIYDAANNTTSLCSIYYSYDSYRPEVADQ